MFLFYHLTPLTSHRFDRLLPTIVTKVMPEADYEINGDLWAPRACSPVESTFSEFTQLDDEELAALGAEVGNFQPVSANSILNGVLPVQQPNPTTSYLPPLENKGVLGKTAKGINTLYMLIRCSKCS
jgi:hypothetical protein